MKAALRQQSEISDNISPLAILPKRRRQAKELPEPFRIVEFSNPRTGSQSWRVTGWKRDRTRVRENYSDPQLAKARKLALATEWLSGHVETGMQATKLTPEQCRLAEAAFLRLGGNDIDILPAVENWLKTGKQHHVTEEVRIDDAFEQFKAWMEAQPDKELSHATKQNLRNRVNIFANSIGNMLLTAITGDVISQFLDKRNVSAQTKTNDRLALSRFFVWCKAKKWIAINPARKEEKTRRPARPEPVVISVDDAKRLLHSAEKFKRGKLAPYVAVCLFGGLRPTEAKRLTWERVNLDDGEISVSSHNKTKRGRMVKMSATLKAWLTKYNGKPFYPKNWRNDFDDVRLAAGFGNPEKNKKLKAWTEDVLRHTAISHYFRDCGSYGLTAEWAGNSEEIIKGHYQGKVSSEDTKRFYALRPGKGGRK